MAIIVNKIEKQNFVGEYPGFTIAVQIDGWPEIVDFLVADTNGAVTENMLAESLRGIAEMILAGPPTSA